MTTEQKFQAILALGEASLRMRAPGDWYVSQSGVEVKKGGVLEARYGNGTSPYAAIDDHWEKLTRLNFQERVILNASSAGRKSVMWNGFMWEDRP